MLQLHYSDSSVVTSDDIGHALLEYARVLADNQAADVVTIPVIEERGISYSMILIGPSSQLYTTPLGPDSAELNHASALDDRETLQMLEERAMKFQDDRTVAPSSGRATDDPPLLEGLDI